MTTQLEMFRARAGDPNVQWLEDYLFAQRDWVTAAEILAALNRPPSENEKRRIRALSQAAAKANGTVISGQRGYRHMKHATIEEARRAYNTLHSESRELEERAMSLSRAAHKIFG